MCFQGPDNILSRCLSLENIQTRADKSVRVPSSSSRSFFTFPRPPPLLPAVLMVLHGGCLNPLKQPHFFFLSLLLITTCYDLADFFFFFAHSFWLLILGEHFIEQRQIRAPAVKSVAIIDIKGADVLHSAMKLWAFSSHSSQRSTSSSQLSPSLHSSPPLHDSRQFHKQTSNLCHGWLLCHGTRPCDSCDSPVYVFDSFVFFLFCFFQGRTPTACIWSRCPLRLLSMSIRHHGNSFFPNAIKWHLHKRLWDRERVNTMRTNLSTNQCDSWTESKMWLHSALSCLGWVTAEYCFKIKKKEEKGQ